MTTPLVSDAATVSPAMAASVAVRAQGLTRRFGALTALKSVSFDIPAGSICGLIGPNGAGKTTLLRILAGLDEPDEGVRELDGVDVGARPQEAKGRFGYVPDYAGLYDSLTVKEVVEFFAAAQGVPTHVRGENVQRALAAAGLESVSDRSSTALSRGMSQRACVACALVHDPPVLLMDEPAAGLDPRARIELRELLKELRRSGKTIVISSHILSELGDMVDRVLIIERGVLKAAGPVGAAWQEAVAEKDRPEVRVRLEVVGEPEAARTLLADHALVASVTVDNGGLELVLKSNGEGATDGPPRVAQLVKALVEGGVEVCAVVPHRPNLEALFMTVTKGELQ